MLLQHLWFVGTSKCPANITSGVSDVGTNREIAFALVVDQSSQDVWHHLETYILRYGVLFAFENLWKSLRKEKSSPPKFRESKTTSVPRAVGLTWGEQFKQTANHLQKPSYQEARET